MNLTEIETTVTSTPKMKTIQDKMVTKLCNKFSKQLIFYYSQYL